MTRPPSSLRNLGPKTDAAFRRAGIETADELLALGPDEAYARLLGTGAKPHFAMFWALTFAIQDRHWTDLGPEEKALMRARFDAVVARAAATRPEARDLGRLEAELDRLGVRDQPTSSRPEKK
jgi:DNA transformation protein and related proteins